MTKWILAAGAAALAASCMAPGMGQPGGMSAAEANAARAQMLSSQQQASAAAVHPGDDKLECAALQSELMALMQDPSFKASMAAMTGRAQTQADAIKSAQAGGKQVSPDSQTARDAQGDMRKSAADTTAMMPGMMRAQRVTELAQAKKCAFLNAPAKG